MARKLKPSEFYRSLARKSEISVDEAQQNWESTVDFIVEELQRYGEVLLPNFATLRLLERGGKMSHVPIDRSLENRGKVEYKYLEPYYKVSFIQNETFKNYVNGNKLTKSKVKKHNKEIKNIEEQILKELENKNKKEVLIEKARELRQKRIARNKEISKMSKKKRQELEDAEKFDPYDYGNEE